jgi:hypothetical protein
MVVWRMALALCSSSFGTACLVVYTPGVSCLAPLEVQWGVRIVGRFLGVVGFWRRCAFDSGVTRWVQCSMAPLLGELRPVTDARLHNGLHLRNCNGRAGGCVARLCKLSAASCILFAVEGVIN